MTAFIHPPAGDAITINASGATVVLRGLTIDGAGVTGNGMNIVAVSFPHVENCVIGSFAGTATSGNGIYFNSPGHLFVKDTIIRGNAWIGIWVTSSGTPQASLDHCRTTPFEAIRPMGSSAAPSPRTEPSRVCCMQAIVAKWNL